MDTTTPKSVSSVSSTQENARVAMRENASVATTDTTTDPTTSSRTGQPAGAGNWFVLVGIVLYLCEFVGFAIAGGYPSNEPGTPLDQVPAAYVGFEDGAGFLVGWMALVLTGRILIVIGLRSVIGRSALLDWAVAAMVVSVVVEVVSVGAIAAAAALVAKAAGLDSVVMADQLAWSLGSGATAAGGLAALLAALGMSRSGLFPRALTAVGVVLGAVMLTSGLLAGAPATYPVASTLSIAVLFWFCWVVWTGILLARRAGLARAAARLEQ